MEKWFCWGAMGLSALLLILFVVDMVAGIPFMQLSAAVDILAIMCCAILFYLGWNAFQDLR
ncbi:MAG: hypothetical protein AB7K24_18580 [Gemmataceae bacterium]